jgi:NADH dehydrogenase
MSRKNIVIAGGGFAGVSALRRFGKHKHLIGRDFDLILIDKKPYFEFLPMLPDVIGGWMTPELLRCGLADLAKRSGADFLNEKIQKLDPGNRIIKTDRREIDYEYAVLATGSETDFYGSTDLAGSCLKLDNVDDAIAIKNTILAKAESSPETNVFIIGGGYTGVEIATNADLLLKEGKYKYRICIVEKSDEILMMIPRWMRVSVKRELAKLGIEVTCGDSIKEYDGSEAVFGSDKRIGNAVCIWAAGVRTPRFMADPEFTKKRTRVVVDEDLSPRNAPYKNIFMAGDNACFTDGNSGKDLRMAVMFSMGEGKTAADNIAYNVRGKHLVGYAPVDLGYLVPMAHRKAPGMVLGIRVGGVLGYIMHYFMCAYRSVWRNKTGILKELVLKFMKKGGTNGQKQFD